MRLRAALLIVTMVLVYTAPTAAVSNPNITGIIAGVELCPQSICGVAAFAGSFIGQVNERPASGVFWAGITHDPLPEPNAVSAITGGVWLIRTRQRVFSGYVLPGGVLHNKGDNTFDVTLTLVIVNGGTGDLAFTGMLNHNVFPPTIIGEVSQ